ncbi:Transcription initiation factor TFIID subunit 6 [Hondaea fermentalgiana]|uniref:Transcription initiation factor TFIID subunit 6 n=1 Tax=Hondaea fermentalgiana TaxID=2315210 RepID=A0A2R5GS75_9STRA|nr:Transcription initiation factor TFIID subunit 6 [Hondaea fermentalgiana]|eukprot:GBG33736.1 Transcription initiation factor TFIID subunit 6 [Hondaea fermentalgiana]
MERSLFAKKNAATLVRRLTIDDVENALRVRKIPVVHGFGVSKPDRFKFLQYQNLYFLEQEDVDLGRILEDSEQLFLPKKVPLRPSFGIHWLAINGVQPTIAENPHLLEGQGTAKEKVKSDPQNGIAKHVLTKELQIYYEKVVLAVVEAALGNSAAAESVYASLAVDPGLQQLMPYLAKFIFDQVNKSLSNLALLKSVMRLTRCILINPNLDKELYLHEMMPPIMTCIVHRRLCTSPFQDHWSLRDAAATLIPIVYGQYGDTYQNIKPRVQNTLRDALMRKDRPLTTQYGAIVGIAAMGPLTVQAVLLPVMAKLLRRYSKAMLRSRSILERREAQHCVGALQSAFGSYLRACASPELSKAILLEEHAEMARAVALAAGEATIPWQPHDAASSSHLFLFV